MITKKLIPSLFAILLPLSAPAMGQPPVPDSLSVELEEVTVKASPVIRKADRDVYMPSAVTKEKSAGGLSLLNNMQLPGVGINDYKKTISVNGVTPELRINNRRTTIDKVMALDASNISRVELITNPGARYGNAPAVINIIVRNPDTGGYAMYDGSQAIRSFNLGDHSGAVSVNRGYSQFDVNGGISMREDIPSTRVYDERFQLIDGSDVSRSLVDTVGHGNAFWANLSAAYSYSRPDKLNLYTSLNFNRSLIDTDYMGRIKTDGTTSGYVDESSTSQTSPSAHIYLDYNLGRRQMIVVDVDAKIGNGMSTRVNDEFSLPHRDPLLTIDNRIKSRSYGVALNAMYTKDWDNASFASGVNYRMARSREEYITGSSGVNHQRSDLGGMFGEYMRKLGPVSVTAGIGAALWHNEYVENSKSVTEFLLVPDISMMWMASRKSSLRLNYNLRLNYPSLTETSAIYQPIDAFQAQIGNPGLKTYTTYVVGLTYSLNASRLSGSLKAEWRRAPGAVMSYSYYGPDGMIVNSWDNAPGFTQYTVSMSPRLVVIPGWLTVNGTVGIHHYRNHGVDYLLSRTSFFTELTAQLDYRNFTLSAYFNKSPGVLDGQTEQWSESYNMFSLKYRYRHFTFSASLMQPFGHYYDMCAERYDPMAWNKVRHHFAIERTVKIGVNYNINWGRRKNGVMRILNSSAGVEQTKAAGK